MSPFFRDRDLELEDSIVNRFPWGGESGSGVQSQSNFSEFESWKLGQLDHDQCFSDVSLIR